MSITFQCPQCEKKFRVEDRYAGRDAPCPSCKTHITIPAADGQASRALQRQLTPAEKPISFRCPYCDEQVQLAATLAGKQAPCPQCRRIVKVPMPTKEGPKDWRSTGASLPSAARRDTEAAPEGSWGSGTTTTTTVSREALDEAAAVPETAEPVPLKQRIVRYSTGVVATVAVLALAVFLWRTMREGERENNVGRAIESLKKVDAKDATPGGTAEIHRATLEYHRRAGQFDSLKNATKEYVEALKSLSSAANIAPIERDLLLTALALEIVELGGDKAEVNGGQRILWKDLPRDLEQALRRIESPEVRNTGKRAVFRRLIERGQGPLAVQLARADGSAELRAAVAVDLAAAGAKNTALAEATTLSDKPEMATPTLLALWLTLGQPDKAQALTPAPKDENDQKPETGARVGYAEGYFRSGKWTVEQVRTFAEASRSSVLKGRIYLAVAEAAIDKEQVDAAKTALTHALNVLEGDKRGFTPWYRWQLVQAACRAGSPELVKPLIEAISDNVLRGRAQLTVYRTRLASLTNKAEESSPTNVDANTLEYALASEALARHNARFSSGIDKTVGQWEPAWKPFGYVGIALGSQDAQLGTRSLAAR
jgi:hypothetical protein